MSKQAIISLACIAAGTVLLVTGHDEAGYILLAAGGAGVTHKAATTARKKA